MYNPLTSFMQKLLDVSAEQLTAVGHEPDLKFFLGGDPVWDPSCGTQLYVRLAGISMPDAYEGGRCAPAELRANLLVGVLRCAPFIRKVGSGVRVPTPEELIKSQEELNIDIMALLTAIQCSASFEPIDWYPTIGEWTTFTPEGGVHGGEWSITVPMPNCAVGC